MAVISLRCNSSSWACSLAKGNIDGSYHFGFSPGNFLQLAFPCTKDFNNDNNANSIHFAFAIYLLNTSGGKGRISTETPQTKQKDAGATQITLLILLPLLLRSTYRSDNPYPVSSPGLSKFLSIASLTPLGGPVWTPSFRISPVQQKKRSISPHSPVSSTSFRTFSLTLSSHLSSITSLRISSATTLHVLDYLQSNHFLPGTSSESMSHTYVWDLSWTISFDAPGIKEALELLSHSHPGLCHLFRALGSSFSSFSHPCPRST